MAMFKRLILLICTGLVLTSIFGCGGTETRETALSVRKIVFTSRWSNIYVINADGSGEIALNKDHIGGSMPTWSPDRSFIAYISEKELYVIDADGSNRTRLTNNGMINEYPSWSPDGTKIAFVSRDKTKYQIWIINSDGTNPMRVADTITFGQEYPPAWSPDSNKLAYVSGEGMGNIYVVDINDLAQTRLTEHPYEDFRPQWSPDGNRIAFLSNRTGYTRVYIMNADGNDQTLLCDIATWDFSTPDWSPDGQKIVFACFDDINTYQDICVVNLDGTGFKKLVNNIETESDPRWSPDGSKIAFISYKTNYPEIYIMNADGSNIYQLTKDRYVDEQFSWAP